MRFNNSNTKKVLYIDIYERERNSQIVDAHSIDKIKCIMYQELIVKDIQ